MAIRIDQLSKRFGANQAVDALDLHVEAGDFVGLLGPNGAGKSTTIGAITGLVRPDTGTIRLHGQDVWREASARRHVGVCPQEPNFDDFLGLERILAYHGGYFGMPYPKALERARSLLRRFELYDERLQRTSTLSGGMKRRLLLARAMMHEPSILILDEPTAGVDVELRRSLWEHVRELNDAGTTILLTTHYLEEAEALCNDVAVIDNGRIIAKGSPDQLRNEHGTRRVVVTPVDLPDTLDVAKTGFILERGRLVREGHDVSRALQDVLKVLDRAGIEVEDVEVDRTRLEDVFLHLTRKNK